MKKVLLNNFKYIILVFVFIIGIGTFLVQESFAIVEESQTLLQVDDDYTDGGGGSYTPPPPAVTVTVLADGQTSKTINRGDKVRISWQSTGATSCSRYDNGVYVGTLPTSDFFDAYPETTTIFTVTCKTLAYCSGSYTDTTQEVDWNGSPFDWTSGIFYGDHCGYCSDTVNIHRSYGTDSESWYGYRCVQTGWPWCTGSRWSESSYTRSAYAIKSCSDFSQHDCRDPSHSGCTWNP